MSNEILSIFSDYPWQKFVVRYMQDPSITFNPEDVGMERTVTGTGAFLSGFLLENDQILEIEEVPSNCDRVGP